MRWNSKPENHECQIFLSVDCSKINYNSTVSPVVMEAVNRTLDNLANRKPDHEDGKMDVCVSNCVTVDKDPTPAEKGTNENTQSISDPPVKALDNSLLINIDVDKSTEEDLSEAFCRDIDSFSFEFGQGHNVNYGNYYRWFALLLIVVFLYYSLKYFKTHGLPCTKKSESLDPAEAPSA